MPEVAGENALYDVDGSRGSYAWLVKAQHTGVMKRMQAILQLIAQERCQFEAHPFFQFLRNDCIAPETRMAYVPYCCHFVLTFADYLTRLWNVT